MQHFFCMIVANICSPIFIYLFFLLYLSLMYEVLKQQHTRQPWIISGKHKLIRLDVFRLEMKTIIA